jgi:uncharacterized membrane protein YhaH (DUF805 family)
MATKKGKTVKKAAQEKSLAEDLNDGGFGLIFGALLMGICNFHEGDVFEKVGFCCGVLLFMVGIIVSARRMKKLGKNGLAALCYCVLVFSIFMIGIMIASELGWHPLD